MITQIVDNKDKILLGKCKYGTLKTVDTSLFAEGGLLYVGNRRIYVKVKDGWNLIKPNKSESSK